MAEIVRVQPEPKSSQPKLVEVPKKKAPKMSPLEQSSFTMQASKILEKVLLDQGLIIPKDKLKMLLPAYLAIGKLYWETVENSKLF